METASIIVDFYNARCNGCKCVLRDELAERCAMCGCVFDRVASNHVTLAGLLETKRREAGVVYRPPPDAVTSSPATAGAEADTVAGSEPAANSVPTASLVVDFYAVRCGGCKVSLPDELALECPVCGAKFERVVSNHVGLAARLQTARGQAAQNT